MPHYPRPLLLAAAATLLHSFQSPQHTMVHAQGNPPCYVCFDGGVSKVTFPSVVLDIPSDLGVPVPSLTCGQVQTAAEQLLLIPEDDCPILDRADFRLQCGCENELARQQQQQPEEDDEEVTQQQQATEEPTASPVEAPTTSEPTSAPVESPTTSEPTASPVEAPVTTEPSTAPADAPIPVRWDSPTHGPADEPPVPIRWNAPTAAPMADDDGEPTTDLRWGSPTRNPSSMVIRWDSPAPVTAEEPTVGRWIPPSRSPSAEAPVSPRWDPPTIEPTAGEPTPTLRWSTPSASPMAASTGNGTTTEMPPFMMTEESNAPVQAPSLRWGMPSRAPGSELPPFVATETDDDDEGIRWDPPSASPIATTAAPAEETGRGSFLDAVGGSTPTESPVASKEVAALTAFPTAEESSVGSGGDDDYTVSVRCPPNFGDDLDDAIDGNDEYTVTARCPPNFGDDVDDAVDSGTMAPTYPESYEDDAGRVRCTDHPHVVGFTKWSDVVRAVDDAKHRDKEPFILCPGDFDATDAPMWIDQYHTSLVCGGEDGSCRIRNADISVANDIKGIRFVGIEFTKLAEELHVGSETHVAFVSCIIRDSVFPGSGDQRAAVVSEGHLYVKDTVFERNLGDGAILVASRTAYFDGCQFLQNAAADWTTNGSAVSIGANDTAVATVSFRNSCFDNNQGPRIVYVRSPESVASVNIDNAVTNLDGDAECEGIVDENDVCDPFAFLDTTCSELTEVESSSVGVVEAAASTAALNPVSVGAADGTPGSAPRRPYIDGPARDYLDDRKNMDPDESSEDDEPLLTAVISIQDSNTEGIPINQVSAAAAAGLWQSYVRRLALVAAMAGWVL